MFKSKIILSHPFSAPIYILLFQETNESFDTKMKMDGHSYYKTIFGKNYQKNKDLSLTFTVLYDQIILPPADVATPNPEKYLKDDVYNNKDVGLYMDWGVARGQYDYIQQNMTEDIKDPFVQSIFNKMGIRDEYIQLHILNDIYIEIEMSNIYKCPIICGLGRRILIDHIVNKSTQISSAKNRSNAIKTTRSYLDVVGPLFNPVNMRELAIIKSDKDVRDYASAFVRTIEESKLESNNSRRDLLENLSTDIDRSKFANKVHGYFSMGMNVLEFAFDLGLSIPFIGTAIKGIRRLAENKAKQISWYEFGPNVKKASNILELEKKVRDEIKKLPPVDSLSNIPEDESEED